MDTQARRNDFLRVWFTTDVTLESLTAYTHHHGFYLVVPGGKSNEGEIWSGAIYRASAE